MRGTGIVVLAAIYLCMGTSSVRQVVFSLILIQSTNTYLIVAS